MYARMTPVLFSSSVMTSMGKFFGSFMITIPERNSFSKVGSSIFFVDTPSPPSKTNASKMTPTMTDTRTHSPQLVCP